MAWFLPGEMAYPPRGYADTFVNPYVDQQGWMHLGPRRGGDAYMQYNNRLFDHADENRMPVGSLSPQVDGYCYLHIIPRSNWQVMGMRFGANPLLSDLMLLPAWELDFSNLDNISYELTSDGEIHLTDDVEMLSFAEFLYSERLLLRYCRSFMRGRVCEIAEYGWRVGGKNPKPKQVVAPVFSVESDHTPNIVEPASDQNVEIDRQSTYESGFCYLRAFREDSRDSARAVLGSNPKVSDFLALADTIIDIPALAELNIVPAGNGAYHMLVDVAGGAHDVLVRTLATCDGYHKLKSRLGGKCGIGTKVPLVGVRMLENDVIGGVTARIASALMLKHSQEQTKHGTIVSDVLSRLTVPGFESGKVFSTYVSSIASDVRSTSAVVRERSIGSHLIDSCDWQLLVFPPGAIVQLNSDVVVAAGDREYWLYVKGRVKLRVAAVEYWYSVLGIHDELAVSYIWADSFRACDAAKSVFKEVAAFSTLSWETIDFAPKLCMRRRLAEDSMVVMLEDGLCYNRVSGERVYVDNGVRLSIANAVIAWYA